MAFLALLRRIDLYVAWHYDELFYRRLFRSVTQPDEASKDCGGNTLTAKAQISHESRCFFPCLLPAPMATKPCLPSLGSLSLPRIIFKESQET